MDRRSGEYIAPNPLKLQVYRVNTTTPPQSNHAGSPVKTDNRVAAMARNGSTSSPRRAPKIMDLLAGDRESPSADVIPKYPPTKGPIGAPTKWTIGIAVNKTMIPNPRNTPLITEPPFASAEALRFVTHPISFLDRFQLRAFSVGAHPYYRLAHQT